MQSTDRSFLEEMEKRLQKRIVVKARGSFHVEDFEIRSPNDKTPIEKSEVATGARDDKDGMRDGKRRRRRRRHLGPPAEVEAMLAEEEESAVDPEALAGAHASESRNGSRGDGGEPVSGDGGGRRRVGASSDDDRGALRRRRRRRCAGGTGEPHALGGEPCGRFGPLWSMASVSSAWAIFAARRRRRR